MLTRFTPCGPFSLWPRRQSLPMLPVMRVFPVGGSLFYGLPDRPVAALPQERDKPAPSYTRPSKPDVDVKLAQLYRLTGLKGTAVLSRSDMRFGREAKGRMLSATGRATRNVPIDLSGEIPDARCAVFIPDGDVTVSGDEMRLLRRYREAMRGESYAKSMAREATERSLAYWRAAFPWIPCDSHGKLWEGKRYNRKDGIGERIYADGSMLSERKRDWDAAQAKSAAQLDRDAEIARLAAEQERDNRETRTRRVKAAIESERKPLRFA